MQVGRGLEGCDTHTHDLRRVAVHHSPACAAAASPWPLCAPQPAPLGPPRRAILKIGCLVGTEAPPPPQPQPLAPPTPRVALSLGWMRGAMEGLLALVEAGWFMGEVAGVEVVEAAVGGLATLPLGARTQYLARTWPCIAGLRDAPTRLRLFAGAWAAAIEPLTTPGVRGRGGGRGCVRAGGQGSSCQSST